MFSLTCCDNLKGISETLKAAFPNVHIQKCYPSDKKFYKTCTPKNVASFTSDMKKNYKSPSYDAALKALDSFEKSWGEKYPYAIKSWKKSWGEKYPYAIKSWKNNFDELVTFFDYPTEIRRMIYTTNTIENLNRNITKITKNKRCFYKHLIVIKNNLHVFNKHPRRLWFKRCSQLTSNIKSTNYIISGQIMWYKIVVIKRFKR